MDHLIVLAAATLVILSATTIPPANAQTEVAILTLNKGQNGISAAAIDATGGYAYFGTTQIHWNESASFIKVSLSNFSIVGTLVLGVNESEVRTVIIDPISGFAYLGVWNAGLAFSGPDASISKIVKVRLSDLSRVATYQTVSGGYINSAVIDVKGGFAYFGISSLFLSAIYPPAEIVRIRLSDFAVNSTLPVGLRYDEIPFGLLDDANGFAYFYDVSWAWPNASNRLVKVNLSNFTQVMSVSDYALGLHTNEFLASGIIDPKDGYAYFGTGASTGMEGEGYGGGSILKVKLSDLSPAGRVVEAGDALRTGVLDPVAGFAYFGWDYGNPGMIDVVRLSDFTFNGTLSLSERSLNAAVIDPVHRYAYFAGGTIDLPGYILKIRLLPPSSSTFTTTTSQVINNSSTATNPTTSINTTSAVAPEIPGFRIESIVAAFLIGAALLVVWRHRTRKTDSKP
jgi:hypothetical protein